MNKTLEKWQPSDALENYMYLVESLNFGTMYVRFKSGTKKECPEEIKFTAHNFYHNFKFTSSCVSHTKLCYGSNLSVEQKTIVGT